MMNESTGKLSALQVKNIKPLIKPFKISDGRGLNLVIKPNASKYWRLSYRFNSKQKTLALGVYPVVTLAMAREKTLEAKRALDAGYDPSVQKRQNRAEVLNSTFEMLSDEWQFKESGKWSEGHADKVRQSIKADVLPYLWDIPIKEIKTSDILQVIRRIEKRGALDVASRAKQRISSIFRYAIQTDRAEYNPVDALKDVIKTRKVKHRKALKECEFPMFFKRLESYRGKLVTQYALDFIAHTFVRPGELRNAKWCEFDLENRLWRIPAEKMKMKEEHLVPLTEHVYQLLLKVKDRTGRYDLVFPNSRNYRKVMSENTMTYAIRKRLDFDATSHGFRSTASTILNEHGFRVDVIERQLSHGERNKVRAAYNRSQYLAERTKMMAWYSDYICKI